MSFVEFFNPLTDIFTTRIRNDDFVFRLHHFITVTGLLAFCILMTISQYVGTPMHCTATADVDEDTFNTFCWIHGVTTGRAWRNDLPDQDMCEDNGDCWHHSYYQWVIFVVMLQAASFYLPKFIWDYNEGGRIGGLLDKIDRKAIISFSKEDKEEVSDTFEQIIDHIHDHSGGNKGWASVFYICEALNLLNAVAQFYLTDLFLGGHFIALTIESIFSKEASGLILPLTGRCVFSKMGSSGEEEKHDAICVMPLNLINQKFYCLFGLWLSFLIMISVFSCTLRFILMSSSSLRQFFLSYFYGWQRSNFSKKCSHLTNLDHGDWFLVTRILQNMSGITRYLFLEELEQSCQLKKRI